MPEQTAEPALPTAPPTDPDVDGDAWRLPHHLAAIAIALVAILVAGGWGLHAWGPLHPSVDVQTSMRTSPSASSGTLEVRVRNTSASPLTVDAVVVDVDGDVGMSVAPIPTSPGAALDAAGGPTGDQRPVEVGAGDEVVLGFFVSLLPCDPSTSSTAVHTQVRVTSAWGTDHVHDGPSIAGSVLICPPPLPPETSTPADRAAAVADIEAAYGTAYDASAPVATRLARIDDPRGVAEATAVARQGSYGDLADDADVTVDEVSFDAADHAWVRYDLGVAPLLLRVGEARLVDGRWTVARATVCADLALAGAICPPPG